MDKDLLIIELIKKVENLTNRLTLAEKEITLLKAENKELRSRLNSDSSNSNKSPSSDGYKKKPAFPKKSTGLKGGQQGHKGSNLKQTPNPDKIIKCHPGSCSCGHEFTEHELTLAEKRQVFNLPRPKLEVTEYQLHKAKCPVCGKSSKGIAPEGINAPAQYGNGVKSYVVMLNVHYKMPYKKIQLLFEDLFSCPINESTIYSAAKKCYISLEDSEQIIKSKISTSPVAHADETGIRIEGKLQWLHTASSSNYTYLFMHGKRGKLAMESDKSIIGKIKGWLVHDCWSSYFNFTGHQHAICGAHILRELQGLIDTEQSKWAKIFKTFLMGIFEMPFAQRLERKQQIESRFRRICYLANAIEPPPIKTPGKRGRYKRTKGRNLAERLIRRQDAVLAFAFNEQVPFTNNLAERDIRPVKIKQKISNSFRSFEGAEIYARIEGFISTTRKNKINIFNQLCTTFEGRNFITENLGC